MTVRVSDIVPGARLVTGRRIHCVGRDIDGIVSEFSVVTVKEDEEGLYFLNHAGDPRRIRPNTDAYATSKLHIPHEVMWSMPIPEATDEELRRLVAATAGVGGSHGRDKPWLLHVQSTTEGMACALPVLPVADERSAGKLYTEDDDLPEYVVGNAAIWAHMVRIERTAEDWALRPGALVVMWPGKARIVDGLPLHKARHLIDIMTCSVERLGAWLPKSLSPASYYSGPFVDVAEIEEEEERARLRTQPNQALVYGYVDGDQRGGTMLGTSGITFHHADDLMTNLFGMDDPELGLWVADDAVWTGSGEDVEIQSDMRPATMEDLQRFGWDAEDLHGEIAGHFDVSLDRVPEDICEQAMLQAAEVAAVQDWEESVRKPWSDVSMTLSERRSVLDYRMRGALTDFASEARSRLLASDGMEIVADEKAMALTWPGASLSAAEDGTLEVTTPQGTNTFPPRSRTERRDVFEPLMEWLATRPEHVERNRPNDPRTIMPVRDDS